MVFRAMTEDHAGTDLRAPRRLRTAWAVGGGVLAAAAFEAAFAGCGEPKSAGSGDRVKVDVDASAQPAQGSGDDAGEDSPFARVDGAYGILPDGYAPLVVCAQCACEAGTYCYGGAPSMTLAACDQTASTSLDLGCHAMPAGCANEPDCVCLLRAFGPQMGCYPVCTESPAGGFIVYCPP
jgi:hypothetical protein